jgi:hypothetical protein
MELFEDKLSGDVASMVWNEFFAKLYNRKKEYMFSFNQLKKAISKTLFIPSEFNSGNDLEEHF